MPVYRTWIEIEIEADNEQSAVQAGDFLASILNKEAETVSAWHHRFELYEIEALTDRAEEC